MNTNVVLSVTLQKQCIEIPIPISEIEDIDKVLEKTRLREIFPEIFSLSPSLRQKNVSIGHKQLSNGEKINLCCELLNTPESIRRIKQNRKKINDFL